MIDCQTDPYDEPGYAESYDSKWHTSHLYCEKTKFEMEVVTRLAAQFKSPVWFDIGCGTGFHLRHTEGEIARHGVDRSASMLAVGRKGGGAVTFHERDALNLSGLGPANLVTSFWDSGIHNDTISASFKFFDQMVGLLAPGGHCLIFVDDGGLPRRVTDDFGRVTIIEGVTWSFIEEDGSTFRYLLSLHPEAIVERYRRQFSTVSYIHYPRTALQHSRLNSRLVLFKGKQ